MKRLVLSEMLTLKFSAGGQPVTRACVQPLGAVVAWFGNRLGFSPNTITMFALLLTTGGVAIYVSSWWPPLTISIVSGLFFQAAYILDCADGQLARATGRTSRLGAWWDVYCDYWAVMAVAFAATVVLQHSGHFPVESTMLVGFFFAAARCTSLHSASSAGKPAAAANQRRNLMRTILAVSVDTPVVLLLIAVLRDYPIGLFVCLFSYGILFTVHGLWVGLKWNRPSSVVAEEI